MGYVYDLALEEIRLLDPIMARKIEEIMLDWRASTTEGIMITHNIRSECFLNKDHMIDILKCLHANYPLGLDIMQSAFENECHSYVFQGKEIDKGDVSENVGNGKTIMDFKRALKGKYRTLSMHRIGKIVKNMLTPGLEPTDTEKKFDMANHGCWATWSKSSKNDPFDFVVDPQAVLRLTANLGLDHRQYRKKHMLMIYKKDDVPSFFIPTIADANIYPYFECATDGDFCGRTRPWFKSDYEKRGLIDKKDVMPRIEGVHKPIKLGHLKYPVRTIK